MKPQTFIFIGRSGSGKGTQAALLAEYLKKKDPSRGVLPIQTGQELRTFIQGQTFTAKLMKDIYDRGDLAPEFVAVYQWVKALVERYTGTEHIICDGMPRKLHEAGVLNSIFDFYSLGKPWVIEIEVSAEEALKRLLARKRFDDREDEIRERLSWYETDVAPTIDYYRTSPNCHFIGVSGERPVDDIHADIVKKTGLA